MPIADLPTLADVNAQRRAVQKHCECGCGLPAPIAHITDTKRGYVKGQPRRFILGHQFRLGGIGRRIHVPATATEVEARRAVQRIKSRERAAKNHKRHSHKFSDTVKCACGCGLPAPLAPCSNRTIGYVQGMPTPSRLRAGHRPAQHRRPFPMKACERCGKVTPQTRSAQVFCGRKCAAAAQADQTRKPRHVCALCGKPAPSSTQKSCSAACAYTLRKLKTRKPRACSTCGKEYFPKGRIRLKYCSKRCYVAKQGERPQFVQVTCEQCARIFRRTHGAVKRVKRIFCNRVCRRKFFVGANSPNYRGGHDPNRGCHWISLAAKIRKRDDYTCLRCGMTQVENGRKLDVDHIKPWRSFEDKNEANEPSNLASLCKRCHRIKSATIERDWLRGDRLGMLQYEKAVRLPPLFASVP